MNQQHYPYFYTKHRDLQIAMDVGWWTELIETIFHVERWEMRDQNGKMRKFWRRHGSLPKWAE